MRILHVMAGAAEGGAENIMLESVLALQDHPDIQQYVVTRDNNEYRLNQFETAGIQTATANFKPYFNLATRPILRKAIKKFAPDIIQYWMGRAGQFALPEYHDISVGWYGGYYKLERFENCKWHIGLSKDLCRHIHEQGVDKVNIGLIHTLAEFGDAAPVDRANLNTPETVPVALALARLHWKKGLDTLLEATAKTPGVYVWIAGEGPLEAELKAQCSALGLDERVQFLGWRNDRDALLAACDFVAFPSRYEPFGTVTVDSWAAKRPIIAADAVGPAAYVVDGVNGLLIPKDNVDALAEAMSKLIHDKALCDKLVAGGDKTFAANFTKAAYQKGSLEFYRKIISARTATKTKLRA